jgi:hypothetical protein
LLRVVAVFVALLLAAGCSIGARLTPPTESLPPAKFGDFAVGEFGGVDGRQNILRVRADGAALYISREPAAGRLSEGDLERLRTLLTSEQFRRESALDGGNGGPPSCTDQIITEVRMGSLAVNRTGPCGAESAPAAPAFEEILAITEPARQGVFAAPVGVTGPRLVPVRLERLAQTNQPGYVITVDARGRASIAEQGEPTRKALLTSEQQDTLRLLLPLLDEGSVPGCDSPECYQLRIDNGDVRPDCSGRGRYPEYRAVVAVLEAAFQS